LDEVHWLWCIVDVLQNPYVSVPTDFCQLHELVLRKNFAEIGGTYSRERDAFIPPKPYESCLLNEDTCTWEYPEPLPDVSGIARWDEASYQAGNGGWHEKKKHPEGSPVD